MYFPPAVHAQLVAAAEVLGCSISELVTTSVVSKLETLTEEQEKVMNALLAVRKRIPKVPS